MWIVGLLLLYLAIINIAAPALGLLLGFSDEVFDVFGFPILEEMLKLWVALKFFQHAFSAIVSFGLMEWFLVKAPLLYELREADDLHFISISTLVVLGLHVATAFAYSAKVTKRSLFVIFAACVFLHIVFNSLSLFHLRPLHWILAASAICAAVVAISKLIAVLDRRPKMT